MDNTDTFLDMYSSYAKCNFRAVRVTKLVRAFRVELRVKIKS